MCIGQGLFSLDLSTLRIKRLVVLCNQYEGGVQIISTQTMAVEYGVHYTVHLVLSIRLFNCEPCLDNEQADLIYLHGRYLLIAPLSNNNCTVKQFVCFSGIH